MADRIYLCSHCHRIIRDTRYLQHPKIGGIRVPAPHENADGDPCDGANAEVIEGWDAP